jgi:RNA polymerase sigma factor (sigma-70 family)
MGAQVPYVDPAVLACARNGDGTAHAELYEIFAPMVYTLARRMLSSAAHAEDALQETFIEVLRKIGAYRGEAEFGFWVRRIAVNKCLMHLRSGWTSRRVTGTGEEPAVADGAAEDRIALERALAALSDTARAVVWLHDVEGYTHREIGRLMGRTSSFSKSQLARAHARLRVLLEGAAKDGADTCIPLLKTC